MNARLYAADIRALPPDSESLARVVSAERAGRLAAFRLPDDRLRCLAAGLLLRAVVGGGVLARGEYGKPFLPGGPQFNVSHSGNYALLATDDTPVGIDIEFHAPLPADELVKLASTAFHPAEQARFAKNPAPKAFYDLWALKESYLKYLGTGLSMEPSSFCLRVENGRAALEHTQDGFCVLHLSRAFPGYSAALCLHGAGVPAGFDLLTFSPQGDAHGAGFLPFCGAGSA